MASEDTGPKLDFTLDQLNAVFDKMPGAKACPVCATEDWLAHFGEDWTTSLPYTRPNGDLGIKGFPILAVYCKHCGYIRQHAVAKIRELIEGNGS